MPGARKAAGKAADPTAHAREPVAHPATPDGRYFVVRGRLWRLSNPALDEATRERLVRRLMRARRDIATARRTGDADLERRARRRVHSAKVALGERGPVWWDDSAPDYNRRMAEDTPYAGWWRRRAARVS